MIAGKETAMRTKVTGYLTQKRGFYYVVLNMPSDIKGKRIRKTLSTGLSTARNMTKAKEVMREMIREANAGEEVHGVMERKAVQSTAPESSSPRPDMLFSDYLQFWLQWKRSTWEEVTYSGYAANVNTWIAPYFSQRGTKLNEINVLDIEMFYAHEKNTRNISGNTVAHYHANIHKALVDAVRLKLIPHNPASDVERPKKDNFVASYYTADELMEMFPIFAGTKMELPVLLAAYYGLRRSEVVGLKWSAIDFVNKTITISHTFERVNVDGKAVDISKERTKNNSSFRTLPLIPEVETALIAAKARQEKQIMQLEKEKLEYDLQHKSQEMANLMINFVRKNEMLTEIKSEILKVSALLKGEGAREGKQQLILINNKIDGNIQSDEVLKRIEDQFDLIHNNFMKRLHAKHPELSHNERMMCAYLKMNLSTKEIAPLLNISVRGVETIRYRLRKKFALEREDSLTDYLSNKL